MKKIKKNVLVVMTLLVVSSTILTSCSKRENLVTDVEISIVDNEIPFVGDRLFFKCEKNGTDITEEATFYFGGNELYSNYYNTRFEQKGEHTIRAVNGEYENSITVNLKASELSYDGIVTSFNEAEIFPLLEKDTYDLFNIDLQLSGEEDNSYIELFFKVPKGHNGKLRVGKYPLTDSLKLSQNKVISPNDNLPFPDSVTETSYVNIIQVGGGKIKVEGMYKDSENNIVFSYSGSLEEEE